MDMNRDSAVLYQFIQASPRDRSARWINLRGGYGYPYGQVQGYPVAYCHLYLSGMPAAVLYGIADLILTIYHIIEDRYVV
jgi:hypothetical protein